MTEQRSEMTVDPAFEVEHVTAVLAIHIRGKMGKIGHTKLHTLV
jgi:hypothetical protein